MLKLPQSRNDTPTQRRSCLTNKQKSHSLSATQDQSAPTRQSKTKAATTRGALSQIYNRLIRRSECNDSRRPIDAAKPTFSRSFSQRIIQKPILASRRASDSLAVRSKDIEDITFSPISLPISPTRKLKPQSKNGKIKAQRRLSGKCDLVPIIRKSKSERRIDTKSSVIDFHSTPMSFKHNDVAAEKKRKKVFQKSKSERNVHRSTRVIDINSFNAKTYDYAVPDSDFDVTSVTSKEEPEIYKESFPIDKRQKVDDSDTNHSRVMKSIDSLLSHSMRTPKRNSRMLDSADTPQESLRPERMENEEQKRARIFAYRRAQSDGALMSREVSKEEEPVFDHVNDLYDAHLIPSKEIFGWKNGNNNVLTESSPDSFSSKEYGASKLNKDIFHESGSKLQPKRDETVRRGSNALQDSRPLSRKEISWTPDDSEEFEPTYFRSMLEDGLRSSGAYSDGFKRTTEKDKTGVSKLCLNTSFAKGQQIQACFQTEQDPDSKIKSHVRKQPTLPLVSVKSPEKGRSSHDFEVKIKYYQKSKSDRILSIDIESESSSSGNGDDFPLSSRNRKNNTKPSTRDLSSRRRPGVDAMEYSPSAAAKTDCLQQQMTSLSKGYSKLLDKLKFDLLEANKASEDKKGLETDLKRLHSNSVAIIDDSSWPGLSIEKICTGKFSREMEINRCVKGKINQKKSSFNPSSDQKVLKKAQSERHVRSSSNVKIPSNTCKQDHLKNQRNRFQLSSRIGVPTPVESPKSENKLLTPRRIIKKTKLRSSQSERKLVKTVDTATDGLLKLSKNQKKTVKEGTTAAKIERFSQEPVGKNKEGDIIVDIPQHVDVVINSPSKNSCGRRRSIGSLRKRRQSNQSNQSNMSQEISSIEKSSTADSVNEVSQMDVILSPTQHNEMNVSKRRFDLTPNRSFRRISLSSESQKLHSTCHQRKSIGSISLLSSPMSTCDETIHKLPDANKTSMVMIPVDRMELTPRRNPRIVVDYSGNEEILFADLENQPRKNQAKYTEDVVISCHNKDVSCTSSPMKVKRSKRMPKKDLPGEKNEKESSSDRNAKSVRRLSGRTSSKSASKRNIHVSSPVALSSLSSSSGCQIKKTPSKVNETRATIKDSRRLMSCDISQDHTFFD